eukprot:TRINITY_DN20383_c0_g1_i1.p3 TRINITY_DN20383_c0_g1~~TRINITY_DN20383_c0_g1_i1.p3  ORF type:complete len:137 (+),score=39.19 TRINITY_DN20383_c0_g1_i1:49-411(+)
MATRRRQPRLPAPPTQPVAVSVEPVRAGAVEEDGNWTGSPPRRRLLRLNRVPLFWTAADVKSVLSAALQLLDAKATLLGVTVLRGRRAVDQPTRRRWFCRPVVACGAARPARRSVCSGRR